MKQTEQMTILITGSKGQLGSELKVITDDHPFHFIWTDVEELDLTDADAIMDFFVGKQIDYCINCAAYTAVDRAESDPSNARLINAVAVQKLAEACKLNNVILFHISTDFVFRGDRCEPLNEGVKPEPLSVYGATKLEGEQAALRFNPATIVIRTSWLYSSFGNNFVKTMIRIGKERESLGVVYDQIGTPTYARDLARAIIQIISSTRTSSLADKYGIYHYSNEGVASWYDFARAIFDNKSIEVALQPLRTEEYPTPAQRPACSILDKKKIKSNFGLEIPHWCHSLQDCLELL
jgi:dTDP-4-dehydrorhamnose reductase